MNSIHLFMSWTNRILRLALVFLLATASLAMKALNRCCIVLLPWFTDYNADIFWLRSKGIHENSPPLALSLFTKEVHNEDQHIISIILSLFILQRAILPRGSHKLGPPSCVVLVPYEFYHWHHNENHGKGNNS